CAHWVTPEGLPKRFDTRFFLAALPTGQEPSPDPLGEHESLRWAEPEEALQEAARGECQLLPPTRAVLAWLATSSGVEDALRRGRSAAVETVRPDLGDVTGERYPGLDLSILHRE
ncbi:NUDIX hydrolase, partial [mine drainage metagenome]